MRHVGANSFAQYIRLLKRSDRFALYIRLLNRGDRFALFIRLLNRGKSVAPTDAIYLCKLILSSILYQSIL